MANAVEKSGQPGEVEVRRVALDEVPPPGAAPPGERIRNLDLILDIAVPVSVELGHASLKIQELLDLHAGAVIELDRRAGDPVDVFVNGKLVAQGEVVAVDDTLGVRITAITERAQRIRSLDGTGH